MIGWCGIMHLHCLDGDGSSLSSTCDPFCLFSLGCLCVPCACGDCGSATSLRDHGEHGVHALPYQVPQLIGELDASSHGRLQICEASIWAACDLHHQINTSFIIDDDLMAVDFAIVGVFVCSHEVFFVVELHKTVPARFAVLVAHNADGLDDTVLLGGKRDTSNSYLRVF